MPTTEPLPVNARDEPMADSLPDADLAVLRRHASFVQYSADPVLGGTVDGIITDWNPAAERLYGYTREEAVGAPLDMLVPPELQASTAAWLGRAGAGEATSQVDTQRMAKDGRRIDVSISVAPVRDERGAIVGAVSFTRDIGARVAGEKRLRTSEAQLAEAQELAGLGSWEWDLVTNEVPWSAGLYRILGVDPATFTPTYETYFSLVHPDDKADMQAVVQDTIDNAVPMLHTHRVVRPDGGLRITESRARAVVDEAGKVIRLAGTVQDVTEAVEARQRLDRVSRYNETLLNCAGDGIYGLARDGSVTFVNPAALRATGHDIGELTGCDLQAMVQHTRPDGLPYARFESPIAASLRDGAVRRCDQDVFWRRDGTCFAVEYTSTPLLEDGQIAGAVVIFNDISERREVERIKDELTSVVSHELRTPLASIRGSLGLLESGALQGSPEKAQRMIEIAVQNTDRVVRLINDILDIERIGAGTIEMNVKPCDAAQLLERVADAVTMLADTAGVTVQIQSPPVRILADADRIIQTLINLIGNAVKFSEPGATVRVTAEARDREVLFRVSDDGRGIPPDKLETIFERFEQVDASDSRQKGGTGIGLTICRAIVTLHGGRIWADSPAGAGATFSFTLPA